VQSAYWCKGYQEDTTICYLNADYGKRAASVVRFLPRLTSPGDIIVMNIVPPSPSFPYLSTLSPLFLLYDHLNLPTQLQRNPSQAKQATQVKV